MGADADLNLYHDNSDAYFDNNTGDFYIRNAGSNPNQIYIQGKGGENGIIVNGDGAVELYHSNTKMAETISNGFEVFGNLIAENDGAGSGTSEIQLQPYGTDAYINCTASGSLYTRMGSGYDIRTQIDGSGNFIVQSGNLKLATAGKGIDFSSTSDAAGMTSELFDDYEEGTWTPAGVNFTVATIYSAHYTRTGNVVFIQMYVQAGTGSGASAISVSGLPYTVKGSNYYAYAACRIGGSATQGYDKVFQFNSGATNMTAYVADGNINEGMISGQHLIMSGCYHVA